MTQELSATVENYLAAIWRIEEKRGFARVRDIAEALRVANSTATAALKVLHQKGLIHYEPYDPVTLTQEGRDRAERIVISHRIIRDFLESVLDIDPQRADDVACGMEHAIDRGTLERLICFLAFLKHQSARHTDWLEQFRLFIREGSRGKTCREYVEAYLRQVKEDRSGRTTS